MAHGQNRREHIGQRDSTGKINQHAVRVNRRVDHHLNAIVRPEVGRNHSIRGAETVPPSQPSSLEVAVHGLGVDSPGESSRSDQVLENPQAPDAFLSHHR